MLIVGAQDTCFGCPVAPSVAERNFEPRFNMYSSCRGFASCIGFKARDMADKVKIQILHRLWSIVVVAELGH
ncbi:Uncharacterised protein [Vibrio cholerae]|nr:Uncharacterised protein [Vibrio cholerae]